MKGRGCQADDSAQAKALGRSRPLLGGRNDSTVAGVNEIEKGEDEVGEKPGPDLQSLPS